MEAVRWAGFLAGVAVVLITWHSIITTIIVPRLAASAITYVSWEVLHQAFLFVVNRQRRYERKDHILALLGPLSLLSMLVTWIILFVLGYALMFWPLTGGSFGGALYLAGSSLFTLGVASTTLGGPIVLEFVAAATGMIVIALQVGYLPTIYGAYNRRETLVTALSARSGKPAWGPEVLARHQLADALPTLPALFAAWELWAADITESHNSYPALLGFRSPDPLHSWLISLLAVLDAAALYIAISPQQAPPEARQVLRAGFEGMRSLAQLTGRTINHDPRPDDPLDLTFPSFQRAYQHLRDVGFPLERAAEDAWPHFRGWRVNYEAAAHALADFLIAVPAPWSDPRQNLTYEETFDSLANRPRHRTPHDPEGHAALPRTARDEVAVHASPDRRAGRH